jgi:hypothetical protein
MVSYCVSIPTYPTTPPSIVMRLCDPLWSFSRVSGGGSRGERTLQVSVRFLSGVRWRSMGYATILSFHISLKVLPVAEDGFEKLG